MVNLGNLLWGMIIKEYILKVNKIVVIMMVICLCFIVSFMIFKFCLFIFLNVVLF